MDNTVLLASAHAVLRGRDAQQLLSYRGLSLDQVDVLAGLSAAENKRALQLDKPYKEALVVCGIAQPTDQQFLVAIAQLLQPGSLVTVKYGSQTSADVQRMLLFSGFLDCDEVAFSGTCLVSLGTPSSCKQLQHLSVMHAAGASLVCKEAGFKWCVQRNPPHTPTAYPLAFVYYSLWVGYAVTVSEGWGLSIALRVCGRRLQVTAKTPSYEVGAKASISLKHKGRPSAAAAAAPPAAVAAAPAKKAWTLAVDDDADELMDEDELLTEEDKRPVAALPGERHAKCA